MKNISINCKVPEKELIERIAELEHNQWWEWSKAVAKELKSMLDMLEENKDGAREGVIAGLKARLSRWDELWDFYKFLPGEAKEQDRVYARKVVDMLKSLSY